VVFLGFTEDISEYFNPDQIRDTLKRSGPAAPLIFILIMSMAIVISPIPSLPLDIAAGTFFGPVLGTIYSVIGATIGSVISFLITRILGRELIERLLTGHINFCTSCSDKILTKAVFLSRLFPFISFDVVSYGAGLTKMSLRKFVLATFFGMIPLTFVYNYFGSVLLFHDVVVLMFGLIMTALFFVVPRWIEKRGIMKSLKHD
jgi:uncharacterized membrane protein YdjX (TVP38/TMEM64 family)